MGEKGGEEEVTTPSTPEGRVAVVIVPSLSLQHLKYLNSHTYFYKVKSCLLLFAAFFLIYYI